MIVGPVDDVVCSSLFIKVMLKYGVLGKVVLNCCSGFGYWDADLKCECRKTALGEGVSGLLRFYKPHIPSATLLCSCSFCHGTPLETSQVPIM